MIRPAFLTGLLLTLAAALTPTATAQGTGGKRVTATAAVTPAQAAPGDEVTLAVTIEVQKGWHVYGALQDPANGAPVELKVTELGGLRLLGSPVIPPGEDHEWLGMQMHWIEGRAVLTQRLKIPASRAAGIAEIRGTVEYSACDDQMCEPPGSAAFTASVTVQDPDAAPAAARPEVTPTAIPDLVDPFGLGGDEAHVRASARLVPPDPAPGQETTLEVTVTVASGRHVYGADLPPDAAGLVTSLGVVDAGGLQPVGAAEVPGGEKHEHNGQTEYWLEGEFVVRQRFLVPLDREPGPVEVTAQLGYMTCTLTHCDLPADLTVSATGSVAAGGAANAPAFATSLEPNPARPGETVSVAIVVTVPRGFTLEAGSGAARPDLDLTAGALPVAGDTEVRLAAEGAAELSGAFQLVRKLTIPTDAAPGDTELAIGLDYRLRDADGALSPTRYAATLPLTVAAGPARAEYVSVLGSGLWGLFLLGIGAGIIALLMPCTYPMIPITVSFFSKRAQTGAGTVGLSLIYGIGILLMFNVIGLVIGQPIIRFANHWATNLVFAVAFVAFALSLFGLFTLQLPGSLQNVAGRAAGAGGVFGVFLMGATLVITSFTCTAPIVGTLLAASGGTTTLGIVVGMTGFGLALAVPFVVLSMLPAGTRSIPRAGAWMNDLKIFLGFVELAAALKFLSNVDVALHGEGEWLPADTFLWAWVAIFGATLVWAILPWLKRTRATGVRTFAAVAALALMTWAGAAATRGYSDFVLAAFLPPRILGDHRIVVDDYDAALAAARSQQKLLLINFTGLICANCRSVENDVMPAADVAALLEPGFVEARLHIDYEANAARMTEMVGAVFSPYYIVVDPATGKELGRFQIENVTTLTADFRAFLERTRQPG